MDRARAGRTAARSAANLAPTPSITVSSAKSRNAANSTEEKSQKCWVKSRARSQWNGTATSRPQRRVRGHASSAATDSSKTAAATARATPTAGAPAMSIPARPTPRGAFRGVLGACGRGERHDVREAHQAASTQWLPTTGASSQALTGSGGTGRAVPSGAATRPGPPPQRALSRPRRPSARPKPRSMPAADHPPGETEPRQPTAPRQVEPERDACCRRAELAAGFLCHAGSIGVEGLLGTFSG